MATLVCRHCGKEVAPYPTAECPVHGKLPPDDILEDLQYEFTCVNCGKFVSQIYEISKLCVPCYEARKAQMRLESE